MNYSKEEKAKFLEGWKRSGKSASAYAKENGLVQQTLSRWAKTEPGPKPGFVEVKTKIIPPSPYEMELLVEKGKLKIHIPLCLGSNELLAIVEALEAIS